MESAVPRIPAGRDPLAGDDAVAVLAAAGRVFDSRGWMMGTVGNLSTRLPDGTIVVTASGRHKGTLGPDDFVTLDGDGSVRHAPDGAHPSRETAIHLAIYRCFPEARSCFHVHSVESSVAAEHAGTSLPLPPLEMLKILGCWDEEPHVELAVFDNLLDVDALARSVEERFRATPPAIPALVVRRHGVTAWGDTAPRARDHVEAIEHLLRFVALSSGAGGAPR